MLQPFDIAVWLWRCLTYVLLVCSLYVISRVSVNIFSYHLSDVSFKDVAISILGLQLSQGMSNHVFKNFSSSIIYFLIFGSTFFLTSTYVANIKASYLTTKFAQRIESLAEAMADPKMQLLIGKGSNIEAFLTKGTSELYKEVARRMKLHPENLFNSSNIDAKCFDRVRDNDNSNHNLACVSVQNCVQRYIDQNPDHQLYMAEQSLTVGLGHMVMRKDFQHKEVFNNEITNLKEVGKYDRFSQLDKLNLSIMIHVHNHKIQQ